MRIAARWLGLGWVPLWLLVAVLAFDALMVKNTGRGVGMLAAARARAAMQSGPTGIVVEDEHGVRVELMTKELSDEIREGDLRVLGKLVMDQGDPRSVGLIMECAQGERVGMKAWAERGQTLPSEELMKRGFAAALAKQAAAWPPSHRAEAKRRLDYAERLGRGERWRWTLAPGACVHEAGVAWLLCVVLVRVWNAGLGEGSEALGRGMVAVEGAVVRRGSGERARAEREQR